MRMAGVAVQDRRAELKPHLTRGLQPRGARPHSCPDLAVSHAQLEGSPLWCEMSGADLCQSEGKNPEQDRTDI